jgi:hypothetical protein
MTNIEIFELLKLWLKEMTTAKNVRDKLRHADPSLETMIALEKAKLTQHYSQRPAQPQPQPQHQYRSPEEASAEVENKIHKIFEQGITPALSKEYYHLENKNGKRCWEDRQQRELERGVFYTDKGSPLFSANRKSLCNECGQAIEPGDGCYLRSKEQGVA